MVDDDGEGEGLNGAARALYRSLPHVGLVAEIFNQMPAYGMDAATIWPARFPAADPTNLHSSTYFGPRIPGAMFMLKRDSPPGTTAAFDSHNAHRARFLDIYGYVSPDCLVRFTSTRNEPRSGRSHWI